MYMSHVKEVALGHSYIYILSNSHPTGAGVELHHDRLSRRRPDRLVDEVVQQVLRTRLLEDGLGCGQHIELGGTPASRSSSGARSSPPERSRCSPATMPMGGRGEEGRVDGRVVEGRRRVAGAGAGAGRWSLEGMC